MADAVDKCKIVYPKFPLQEQYSAHRIDAEDARYAGAALGFALCKMGQAFKALMSGHPLSVERQYSTLLSMKL